MGVSAGGKQKVIKDTVSRSTASTFYGDAVDIGGCENISFTENCSAISGTSTTSDTSIQHSHDGGITDAWSLVPGGAFTQRTTGGGAAVETIVPTPTLIKRFVRTKQVTTTAGTVAVTNKVTMHYSRAHGGMAPSRASIPSS